jgi:hypothetical protein
MERKCSSYVYKILSFDRIPAHYNSVYYTPILNDPFKQDYHDSTDVCVSYVISSFGVLHANSCMHFSFPSFEPHVPTSEGVKVNLHVVIYWVLQADGTIINTELWLFSMTAHSVGR